MKNLHEAVDHAQTAANNAQLAVDNAQSAADNAQNSAQVAGDIVQTFKEAVQKVSVTVEALPADSEPTGSGSMDLDNGLVLHFGIPIPEGGGSGVGGAVTSVNGQTGDVVLTAGDVGALSEDSLGDAVDEALDSRLATDNEVNEMIADVFSLEPGQVPDGDVATDQEVDEMLNEVLKMTI